jgi:hypothetical protein
MSDTDTSTDTSTNLSSDDDYESTDTYINTKKKIYQVQFQKDDLYNLKWVGYSDTIPSVNLSNYNHDDYSLYIESNFTHFDETQSTGTCLFDLITMNVIQKDGSEYKLILAVEINNVKLENDNKGNLMIWIEKSGKRCPLKSNLTHPGNEKVPYYIVAELKNEKIKEILNQLSLNCL